MADRITKEVRSWIMSRIRGKGTGLEMVFFSSLRRAGLRFAKHYRKARGTPDAAFPTLKVAVFIDGDFWHGYRYPAWRHRVRKKFWRDKIERNRRRDKRTFTALRRAGWSVVRVWEHEIKQDPDRAVLRVLSAVWDAHALRVHRK